MNLINWLKTDSQLVQTSDRVVPLPQAWPVLSRCAHNTTWAQKPWAWLSDTKHHTQCKKRTASIITENYGETAQRQASDLWPSVSFNLGPTRCWVIPDFQVQDQQAAVGHVLERSGKLTQGLRDLLGHWGEVHGHVAILSRRQHWKRGARTMPIIPLGA